MWSAYLSLKSYQRRPSDDLELDDSIMAYCLDKTVLWFGITVENLLSEMVEVGMGKDKRRERKYTLEQLLDRDFRVPRPLSLARSPQPAANSGFALLLALAGQPGSGVKRWEYVKPS